MVADVQERVFELGERVLVLSHVSQPALVPHMAEAAGQKLPYEVGSCDRTHQHAFQQAELCYKALHQAAHKHSCQTSPVNVSYTDGAVRCCVA